MADAAGEWVHPTSTVKWLRKETVMTGMQVTGVISTQKETGEIWPVNVACYISLILAVAHTVPAKLAGIAHAFTQCRPTRDKAQDVEERASDARE